MTDVELIRKIIEGEKQCFRILVQKYHVSVINTCFGLLHNREDAEDVAQEVFIEVYQSLHRFRGESKLSTWIYRIAVNKSINHLRKTKIRKKIKSLEPAIENDGFAPLQVPINPSDIPSNAFSNKELALVLHVAIDSLPANQRIAFVLHKYEDLAYKEIAEVMKLSLSAVESLIHRAKMSLQKKLLTYYKDQ